MRGKLRVKSWLNCGDVWFKVQRKGWFVWWTLPGLFTSHASACNYMEKIKTYERPTYLRK